MVHHLADWICRAGGERAIDLMGTPTSLCARCCGFYLAIAVGVWLQHVVSRRIGTRLPIIGLVVAVVLTSMQVAIEDSFALADAPALRLGLGGLVGLPLGFLGASRLPGAMRRPFALLAALAPLAVAVAVVGDAAVFFDFALAVGTTLAVAMVVVMAGQIVRDRIRIASNDATKEHAS